MWTQTRARGRPRGGRDGVVEVPGVVGVDREGRQRGEVHARVGRVGLARGALGLGLGRARVAAAQAAVEHQPLEHVARDVGRPSRRTTRAPRLPAPTSTRSPSSAPPRSTAVRGPRPNSGSATRKRPRFSSTATSGWSRRRGGRPRTAALTAWRRARRARPAAPRRAWCSGRRTAFTSGLMPALGDRLAARQVVVGHGHVEDAAVRQRLDLLDHALAERVRADDGRALAVAQRAGHDLRGAGAAAVDEHDHGDASGRSRRPRRPRTRSRRARPRTDTIWPSSMKMLDTSTASRSRPPPLPRRSSTIPSAPASSSLSTSRRSTPCAPALKPAQLDDAELLAVALDDPARRPPAPRSARARPARCACRPRPGVKTSSLTWCRPGP